MSKLKHLKKLSFFHSTTSDADGSKYGPLREWNKDVEKITLVRRSGSMLAAYSQILSILNKNVYNNKLKGDKSLYMTI